jgi:GNAT superfamily N-acetyltransferase
LVAGADADLGNESAFAVMQIQAAKPEDAARLTEIAFAAKRHWGYPERWMEIWRDILTVKPDFIASHETFSAVVDGEAVGFYALDQKVGRLNLLHLWVLPDRMGQGIGRSLFYHAVERTKAFGFRELEIESDPNAEGFYLRMGARRVGLSIHTVEKRQRELPVLIYETDHVV